MINDDALRERVVRLECVVGGLREVVLAYRLCLLEIVGSVGVVGVSVGQLQGVARCGLGVDVSGLGLDDVLEGLL